MTRHQRNELFLQNEKLIWYTIDRFFKNVTIIDREDLYQQGCEVMLNALDRYDESKGVLSTFIVKTLRLKLIYTVSNEYMPVKESSRNSMARKIRTFILTHPSLSKRETYEKLKEIGLVSTDPKSRAMNYDSFNAIWGLINKVSITDESESGKFETDGKAEWDMACDFDISEYVENSWEYDKVLENIEFALANKSEKDKSVYMDWMKINMTDKSHGAYTILGKKYGISRERTRQIVSKINKIIVEKSKEENII